MSTKSSGQPNGRLPSAGVADPCYIPFMALGAVLFDLDGTLVDSERENAEALARAMWRGHGITITQEERDFVIGRSWVDIYTRLSSHYAGRLECTMAELIAAAAAEREAIVADTGLTVLPGAREAIDRFAHLPRAIVTGSSRAEAHQSLMALDRLHAFQVIIAAEDVATSKPDPGGYLSAARALGVAPSACLVVEDSGAGIAAGVAACAHVVAVRAGNFHGQDQSTAHHIIDTLDQLTLEMVGALIP